MPLLPDSQACYTEEQLSAFDYEGIKDFIEHAKSCSPCNDLYTEALINGYFANNRKKKSQVVIPGSPEIKSIKGDGKKYLI